MTIFFKEEKFMTKLQNQLLTPKSAEFLPGGSGPTASSFDESHSGVLRPAVPVESTTTQKERASPSRTPAHASAQTAPPGKGIQPGRGGLPFPLGSDLIAARRAAGGGLAS